MDTVKVSAVQLWSDSSRTPDQNRQHAFEMAERAAQSGPDLVVLPEAVAMLCYPDGRADFSYRDVCEEVPGPSTERFGALARRYETNIVVGLIADRGSDQLCQNVVVVIDRSGTIVGQYEKLHEPKICRTNQDAGVGNSVPVFDLDFGRVGIIVCWDLISPELASLLSLKGADLICLPHMIGLPSSANFAIQIRARAIDTGLPIVVAGMRDNVTHSGSQDGVFPTCFVDADGQIVAQSEHSGADIVESEIQINGDTPNRRHVSRRSGDLRLELYAKEYAALANRS